jgi:hypothetical protein
MYLFQASIHLGLAAAQAEMNAYLCHANERCPWNAQHVSPGLDFCFLVLESQRSRFVS